MRMLLNEISKKKQHLIHFSEGWERLGLFEYYKIKNTHKYSKERVQRLPTGNNDEDKQRTKIEVVRRVYHRDHHHDRLHPHHRLHRRHRHLHLLQLHQKLIRIQVKQRNVPG